MEPLNKDNTFHFELLRVLGSARYFGADIAEVLSIGAAIEPGNFESWYEQFVRLADQVATSVKDNRHPVSVRNALFRAASYYRAADFFLHGNAADPRINETWQQQTACFSRAVSLLDVPAQYMTIPADGFTIPAIFYQAANDGHPRPTILMCNGFDGSQEEMLHVSGFAALERGFNVLTFEGPGQPTVRRDQQKRFITDWENVVTPLVDYCQQVEAIANDKITLLGYSFGGYLAPRAAAFEHRLAAVAAIDGLYDVHSSFTRGLPPVLKEALRTGDVDRFNQVVGGMMNQDTNMRWAIEQGMWSFMSDTPYDFLASAQPMTLAGVVDQIKCPVLVGDAADDRFFKGQPKLLANALGPLATYVEFTAADSAGEHCHVGAGEKLNTVVMDWFADLVGA